MTRRGQELESLHLLARLHGIQTSYVDLSRRTVRASRQGLLATLHAIGAPVQGPEDVPAALRARVRDLWERPLQPVQVAWDGRTAAVSLRLPLWLMEAPRRWTLSLALGEDMDATDAFQRGDLGVSRAEQVDGATFVEIELRPDLELPFGYHRLALEYGGRSAFSTVIAAPRRGRRDDLPASWGVFLPLYALRSERSWGLGDLTDLGDLMEWMRGLGGEIAATLPILSAYLTEPYEPSPYSPVSRLFWNEVHLDVLRAPELERSPQARALMRSPGFRRRIAALQDAPLVDHRAALEAKRQVIGLLADRFFAEPGGRASDFEGFARHTAVRDYASFRANVERRGTPWSAWPHGERDGVLPREGGNRDAFRYHAYVQWLMAGQMAELRQRASDSGARLYFDFPLGVHPDGYDVWKERQAFALGASAGAPPDPFFTGGQNWGFPPLHPEHIREQGYRYVIACLRHVLRHAGVLRIDHIMSLHRLYWVPHGLDSGHGVYVRYRPDELYAILALESSRGGAVIVGEDLGTVPETVRWAMARHGIHRSYVLEMEITGDRRRPFRPPPRHSLASMNTHDLPQFAGFWNDRDLTYRREQGWLNDAGVRSERAARDRLRRAIVGFLRARGWLHGSERGKDEPRAWDVLRGCLSYLASSEARLMLVNLEDLWLEERPQNVPGTTDAYPNWRRPARYRFERFRQMQRVTGTLESIDERRKRGAR